MSDDKLFVASAERYLDRAMTTGRYSAGLRRRRGHLGANG